MTKTELKPLYTEAAARARSTPSSSELAVWQNQLGQGDIRDLRTAIDRHFEKSSWMPKESELKPLMELAQRDRAMRNRAPEELTIWQCEECHTRVSSFRVGYSPKACDGHVPLGPDRGKACTNTTSFRLLYRGSAA